jgi:hypothetical protein
VTEVLSQKDKPERRSGTVFSGTGITNTTPPTKFWVTLCVAEIFKKKHTAGYYCVGYRRYIYIYIL